MEIRITGGTWYCYLCNKEHDEGAGCPRLNPQIRKSEKEIIKSLQEVARKIMETENAGNEKAGATKM
ncbi:hypothetical protein [Xenorhabdus taiwanensis]|uniref:Uncharacterized protein n=1 Tax=Xenorhabdus taiwanensis TaxID=3085177 RepID=A0ABM8K2F4_9GAMM|nr:hypothetical protein TCT1_26950 [Xenorhabdus sp. TCT-1]